MRDPAIDAACPAASETFFTTTTASRPRRERKPRKFGVAPPVEFDLDALPGSAFLTTAETAAVLRRARGTLEIWRQRPGHPLRWEYVDGKPLYRVDAIRAFIARDK
jgi:hypothetical protein